MNILTIFGRGRRARAALSAMASCRWIAAAVGLAALTSAANASNAASGYIYGIYTMSTGAVLFNQTGSRGSPPGCGAGLPTRWAFDGTTAAGQAKLALLLSAYALHKQVTVIGNDDCAAWVDTETVNYIATTNDN